MCDGVQVQREAGRGGGGLHLSAVIFEEVKGGEPNCIDGVRVQELERSRRTQSRTL